MRPLVLLVVLGGCLGIGGGSGTSRPAVTPMLSELPSDPTKRDAVLDQARQTPGPEHHRQQLEGKARKAETAAATAAAIIGSMFSKTQNVTIGVQDTFEENDLFVRPVPVKRRGEDADRDDEDDADDADEAKDPADPGTEDDDVPLVPWVKLK